MLSPPSSPPGFPPGAPKAPPIFSANARHHKRVRAAAGFADHDFLHRHAAQDVVERLETVLKRFEHGVFYGPGAALTHGALTDAADVATATLMDEIPGPAGSMVAAPDALPLADQSADLFVSAMALHATSDIPAALGEARRVLKPDGLFIAVFPGERTLHELRTALQTAEAAVTGKVAPRIAPFVAVKDGGALLQRAGFALPVADVMRIPIEYENPMRLFADLRGAGETSHLAAGAKGALRRDVLAKALDTYTHRYPGAQGGIHVTVELITLTGWAPDQSQPKPLKPGSAKTSMIDAIKGAKSGDRA